LVQVQQDPQPHHHHQQQQQQQVEQGSATGAEEAAAAAPAVGGLSVQQWPWESVGLARRQAGSSSGNASDGKWDCSGSSSSNNGRAGWLLS
jgi:hypothetical protein